MCWEAAANIAGDVLGNGVTLNGVTIADGGNGIQGDDQLFDALGNTLLAESTITKLDGGTPGINADGGNLTLAGAPVTMNDTVTVIDGTLTIDDPTIPLPPLVPPLTEAAPIAGITEQPGVEVGEVALIDVGALAMQWLGEELNIGGGLYATDIQPGAGVTGRLRALAEILGDADGSRMAALGRVVGEFIQSPVPPSQEQMASIAATFAAHSNDGTYYAAAGQWLDALAEYIDILDVELGYTAGEAMTAALESYGSPEAADIAVTAYIMIYAQGLGT